MTVTNALIKIKTLELQPFVPGKLTSRHDEMAVVGHETNGKGVIAYGN